jgi:outer membrane immunogenic protein
MKLSHTVAGSLGAGFIALGLASVAHADGYERGPAYAAPYTWTGMYVGGHGGAAWEDWRIVDVDGYAAGGGPGAQTKDRAARGIFGAQAGYNFQTGPVVFGVEGDLGFILPGQLKLLTGTASGSEAGIGMGSYGDITGRLGFAFGSTLLYAKGGWAFFTGDDSFHTATGSFSSVKHTDTFTGLTWGGGIEHMISRKVSLKLEYQHFDFGSENFTVFNAAGTPFRFKEDLKSDAVKLGFNIKFDDWRAAPLK